MQGWLPLVGEHYLLRPVCIGDARAMLRIRTNGSRNAFIHETSSSIGDQEAWIAGKLACEDDLTMAVVEKSTGEPKGFMSLYEIDVARRSARQGRWLIVPGSRCISEFALLGYTLIFDRLGFHTIYAKIPSRHRTVIAFQTRLGAKLIATAPEYTGLSDGTHRLLRYELSRDRWPRMKEILTEAAERHTRPRGECETVS